jgi:hypothetical protein
MRDSLAIVVLKICLLSLVLKNDYIHKGNILRSLNNYFLISIFQTTNEML